VKSFSGEKFPEVNEKTRYKEKALVEHEVERASRDKAYDLCGLSN
jgi:hypothetical protein